MKRVSDTDSFLHWKRTVDDSIRQLKQGRNLGRKQAASFQIGKVVLTSEEQADGSVILYARHVQASPSNRVQVGVVTKG